MNRIDERFDELKRHGKKALIPFITAGDPDVEYTMNAVRALESAGADIIELGIPYSDPLADGPVIQASSQRALKGGMNLDIAFDMVQNLRINTSIPLVFLIYYNCIYQYGLEKFVEQCGKAGVDGAIVPDLPYEERQVLKPLLDDAPVYFISMVAPTSAQRIKEIASSAKGFLYCVSSLGVTGERQAFDSNIGAFMEKVNLYSAVPTALGFGISEPQHMRRLGHLADGLIVGSALVRRIEQKASDRDIYEFMRGLRLALDECMEQTMENNS
jgi:tryptophan synthase alpha chain